MATSGEQVRKNVDKLKRAMGLKGDLKPGQLTQEAAKILTQPIKKSSLKIPPLHTVKGTAVRGLV